jgi:hypothetical protein
MRLPSQPWPVRLLALDSAAGLIVVSPHGISVLFCTLDEEAHFHSAIPDA